MRLSHRVLLTGALLCALTLTFLLYTRPDFLVQLSNQVWGCF